jgi:hypothetical protein
VGVAGTLEIEAYISLASKKLFGVREERGKCRLVKVEASKRRNELEVRSGTGIVWMVE